MRWGLQSTGGEFIKLLFGVSAIFDASRKLYYFIIVFRFWRVLSL